MELAALLGEVVTERTTLHAWPLSKVEALTMASGAQWIYKTQLPPTVEAEFYEKARSPLLAACRVLRSDASGAELLFPRLLAPTLRESSLNETEFVALGRELVESIGRIQGDVPLFRDLGDASAWRGFVAETLELAAPLWPELSGAIARWSESVEVLRLVDDTSQLISGDLKTEHVFLEPGGPKVIDWQRPLRAPAGVELALLLESGEIPAEKFVASEALGVRWLILAHWALYARANHLPDLAFLQNWAKDSLEKI